MNPIIEFFSSYTKMRDEEIYLMKQITHTSSHKKNERIFQQGSIPKKAVFILKGAIRIYYTDDKGKEFTTAFRFENQSVLPVDSFAQQSPSPTNAVTLEPTELLWTSHKDFFHFLQTFPNYEKVLLQILSKSIPLQNEQTRLLNISSSSERYKMFYKNHPEVFHRVPLKYIASYLGMSLETLSRVRSGKL